MNIVFEGGGIKGLAYIGALRYLEERGIRINCVAGTSVGAIFASLCAVGYTSIELQDLVTELDPNYLWPKSKNIIESAYVTIKKKAVYSMDTLEKYLNDLYKDKNKTMFKDVMIGNNCKLKVIATSINFKKMVVIPDDLMKYNINPNDFSIAKAVCMSSALPLIYQPYKIGKHMFLDGGLFSNFPIWLFDGYENVLGFRLNKKKKTKKIINDDNVIYIDTSRYKATDFRKGFNEKQYLYNLGYYYTKQYFDRIYK